MEIHDVTDRKTRCDLTRRLLRRHNGNVDAAAASRHQSREEFEADCARLGIGARIPIAEQRSLHKT